MLRVRAAWCQKVGVFDDVYLGLYVCTGKGVGAYVLARLSSAQRTRVVVFRVYQKAKFPLHPLPMEATGPERTRTCRIPRRPVVYVDVYVYVEKKLKPQLFAVVDIVTGFFL